MPLLNKPLVSSANFQRTEQEIASLQKEISANQQTGAASTNVPAPGVPLPCTGGTFEGSHGFVIAAQIDKKGEFDTFCAMVPAGCTRLGTLLGKTADQGIRDNTIFHWVDVPDDIAASGGHFEYMFPLNLKYNTQYGLIQLVAVVEDPVTGLTGRKKNPAKPWNPNTQQYSYLDTWTTGNALNAPGTPICLLDPTGQTGDIIENAVYVDHDGGHARLTLRAYFAANRTSTAGQMEATKIGVRLKPVAGGALIQASAVASSDNDKFEDITISDLPEGAQFLWQDVWTKHGTGRAFSAVANCAITAGNVAIDLAGFTAMVNAATLGFAPVDSRHSLVTLSYSQPTSPYAVKKIQILRSDTGAAGTYNIEVPADRPIAEGLTLSGPQTARYLVKTKVASAGFWKVRMLARPGLDVTGSAVFNSNGVADATGDAGPAGVVTNFTAAWEAVNVTFKWKLPATNFTSIVNYNVWATNGAAGSQFMQILSEGGVKAGQHAATQSKPGSQIQSGHHITTKIKLKLMDAPFNTGFTIHVTANNYVNGVLTEGAEATFDVTPGVDYLNATDAVNVLDVSTTVYSPGQILFNGDFLFAQDGPGGSLTRLWTLGVGGPNITNNPSAVIFWRQSTDSVIFQVNGQITQDLKRRLSPGDYFAISFLARSNIQQFVGVGVTFIDESTFFNVTESIPIIPVNTVPGVYSLYGAVLRLSPSATGNPVALNIAPSAGGAGLSAANNFEIDRVMLVRGKQPSAFTPRTASYEGSTSGSENPDITSSNSASGTQDISNPTLGAQGSWVPSGAGTRINLAT
jgi:hypothetical protein